NHRAVFVPEIPANAPADGQGERGEEKEGGSGFDEDLHRVSALFVFHDNWETKPKACCHRNRARVFETQRLCLSNDPAGQETAGRLILPLGLCACQRLPKISCHTFPVLPLYSSEAMMATMQTTCSACGKELPPDAPRGLCPACLFQL